MSPVDQTNPAERTNPAVRTSRRDRRRKERTNPQAAGSKRTRRSGTEMQALPPKRIRRCGSPNEPSEWKFKRTQRGASPANSPIGDPNEPDVAGSERGRAVMRAGGRGG